MWGGALGVLPCWCVPDCGGNEPPIRAAIPVALAVLSAPDPWPDSVPDS